MNWMIQTVIQGIFTILIVAGPIVGIASVIGLSIGLIQTVTNIQDQTTQTALKLFGISTVLVIGSVWMYNYLTDFTHDTFTEAFRVVDENRSTIDLNQTTLDPEQSPFPAIKDKISFDMEKEHISDNAMPKQHNLLQTFGNILSQSPHNTTTPSSSTESPLKTFSQGMDLPPIPSTEPPTPPSIKTSNVAIPNISLDTDLNLQPPSPPQQPPPSPPRQVIPVLPQGYGAPSNSTSGDSLSPPSNINDDWF